MENFCTLFDSNYLSRGLLLYESLRRNTKEFHIYIFAFDALTHNILQHLGLPDATIISLKEFENEKLLGVKPSRTKAEYCWTSTSSAIAYVIENYKVSSCTYLDADLYFYGSPAVLLGELRNGKNILITEHRFSDSARIFEQKRAGRFCVQFITFTNQGDSLKVLDKWKNQCIDWCYARYEDGKFGDQKYLENWPEEYPNVHVLEHPGGGIAPWNARRFRFVLENGKIFGLKPGTEKMIEIVFFHFHFVRISKSGFADIGWNRLTKNIRDLFYKPYIKSINEKEKYLEERFPEYKRAIFNEITDSLKERVKSSFKSLTGFNIIEIPTY
jgi:hypothetical protein